MGLLSSVGIGIGAAANAAQPFIMNMQQAEIQKLRDDRMAEIAKGSADYASKLSLENEQTIYDRKLAREPEETSREIAKKGLLATSEANLEDQRRNDPAYLKGVAAEAAAKRDPDIAAMRKDALDERKEDKSRAKELREWEVRYRTMGKNDPSFAEVARNKIIALGGKDPKVDQTRDVEIKKEDGVVVSRTEKFKEPMSQGDLPAGLYVGAKTKQADGTYQSGSRIVIISGGVIKEIK